MSEKDRADITYGIKKDVDFLALSFVRKAQDVTDVRSFVKKLMEQHREEGKKERRRGEERKREREERGREEALLMMD